MVTIYKTWKSTEKVSMSSDSLVYIIHLEKKKKIPFVGNRRQQEILKIPIKVCPTYLITSTM